MTIMVPVDGSRFSEQALPMALSYAKQTRAVVHLVRVAPGGSTTRGAVSVATTGADAEYLGDVAERWISRSGVPIRTFTRDGVVADALAEHVMAHHVDLVIMTTHGRGGLSRAWLGSVTDRIVRTVRVPVLLRRPLDGADSEGGQQLMPTRILVPLDGSALAETIIDEALAVGELTAAAYTFVQVIAPPITASAEATYEFELEVTAMRRAAHEYLETRAAILRANGHRVSTRTVMQSNVAAAIVEEAIQSECDMIAMATHGRSGLTRIALGSIADKVLRSAAVPMLVMKPDAARTPAQTV